MHGGSGCEPAASHLDLIGGERTLREAKADVPAGNALWESRIHDSKWRSRRRVLAHWGDTPLLRVRHCYWCAVCHIHRRMICAFSSAEFYVRGW